MAAAGNGIGGDGGSPRTAKDLMGLLERMIADGHLPPGQRLDPVRTAARRWDLAPNTVAAAYRRLQERGLLRGEGRRGTFVAERATPHRTTVDPVPDGLVDLASGNPDPALLPPLGPALAAVGTEQALYGHGAVEPDLIVALTADIGPDGPLVPPSDLSPGGASDLAVDNAADLGAGGPRPGPSGPTLVSGALDGIERALQAHLRPGDRVAVEDPGYTAVLHLAAALNLPAVPVPVDRRGPTPDGLRQALEVGVGAFVLTPRAQNPTGAAVDRERAASLRSIVEQYRDVLVVEDDHAGPVAGAPHHRVAGPGLTRWAVVRSLAKAFGPDLRMATLVGDRTTVDRIEARQLLGPGWVSHILQRTATALLTADDVGPMLERAAASYAERRAVVIEGLAAAGIEAWGPSGLNVWVPVLDEAAVVAGMQQRGFALRSGAGFRLTTQPAVRLSVGGAGLDVLAAAAEAMGEVVTGGPLRRWV